MTDSDYKTAQILKEQIAENDKNIGAINQSLRIEFTALDRTDKIRDGQNNV